MTVGLLTEFQAAVLYLLPGAVVLLRISTEKGAMAQAVMWIPAAIAIDLLACLVASWVVPLGVAFLVSRLVWLTLGVELLRRRRWRVERPTADQVRQIGIVVAAGFAAFALSATISRPASIWDRQFHIPLVSMMRGQRLPFLTVFQPNTVLHFHFAGDVMAAGLQVFSFGRLHASLALALAHDLAFGLVGAAMAAWLTTIAPRRLWIVPAVLAIFLSGPFALQRTGLGPLVVGYSYLNLLCMSYRPAVAVAILFLVGAFGAVGLRLSSPEDVPWRRALVVMLSCLAAAGISDEPSAALWGVGLAALWLVQPNVLHARRPVGLLLLVALAAAIIVPNLAFQAALVPGGPVQNIRLIPLRSPGFVQPPLPLFTRSGGYALLMDVAPFLLILAAFVGTCLRRDRKRSDVAMTALLAALLIAATAALTAIDVNGMALESHRFMTVCEIIFPLAALVLLARLPAGHWERLPLIGALLISAVSSYHWSQYGLGDPDAWFTNDVDCRKSAGAGFFERPRPTYIPAKSLYAFAGCRAVFFPGTPNTNSWGGLLFNGYPTGGKGALELLHRQFVPPRENLQAACPVGEETKDPVCEFAKSGGRCRHAGAAFETCEITPEDRARLLTMNW